MDVGLHQTHMYTTQSDVKINIMKWSSDTNDLTQPISDAQSRSYRPGVDVAIDAYNNGLFSPAAVGEIYYTAWATLWFRVELDIPRSIFERGVGSGSGSGGEIGIKHEGGFVPSFRNQPNQIQFHFDVSSEAAIYIPEEAMKRRMQYITTATANVDRKIRNDAASFFSFAPSTPKESVDDSQRSLPLASRGLDPAAVGSVFPRSSDQGRFIMAQGLAGTDGGDRRAEYVLYPFMADNYPEKRFANYKPHELSHGDDITSSKLPTTLRFTFYIEASFNGLFGNANVDDNICPPSVTRPFKFALCEVRHVNMKLNELYWDYVVLRDYGLLHKDSVEGKQVIRLCTQIVNTLLVARGRSSLSNIHL